MTPDQISTVTTVLTLLEKLGGAPFYIIALVIVIAPWVATFFFDRSNNRRFEATKKMYEDNVVLVKNYEKLSDVLMDCVVMNTAQWSEVKDKIASNQFCPFNRIGPRLGPGAREERHGPDSSA